MAWETASEARLSPWLGVSLVLLASTFFAANHVAARVAFDHGTSVATGVLSRAAGTAIVLLVLMKLQHVPLSVPRPLLASALGAGVLVAVQSYCLFSAVALIPAGIALLVFQTSPMLYVLLAWALGRDVPRASSLAAMLVALAGLALVFDIHSGAFAARWMELGAGVLWAFAAAIAYAVVLYANANTLRPIDGRVRTFVMTAVTAIVVLILATPASTLHSPADAIGWAGLVSLTGFYALGMWVLFMTVARVAPAVTVAMNFEPIALLGLGWWLLDQGVAPLQVAGAFVAIGGIVWLSLARR
jgi:drug/metabolite transporter (DMT)-like permease